VHERTRLFSGGRFHDAPVVLRDAMQPGHRVTGPAVIVESIGTIVVEPGWTARMNARRHVVLNRHQKLERAPSVGTRADPVMLEIFNNLFMSIAEQMGFVLANTAASVNIKERLDFSCAIFDPTGSLVANAPHIPVHLGSMSESVKTVIRDNHGDISAGDVYILNAPYNGGTHLPDITIIKPVFEAQGKLLFYVASRGHHADIGGTTPGSAPADSTSIEDEGVIIDNFKLVENNHFREQAIHALLTSGRWPARNPAMNIADFKAQLAACEKGAQELGRMTEYYGVETVHAYMRHVQDNAEASIRRVLSTLRDGKFTYKMDGGHQISVAIKVDQGNREAIIDFTGTSPEHPGNFNAPNAVVKAAVLYVFRCLVHDDIPLNEGCLKPIKIIIPERSMISPVYPAAVFAGNVETSQYLVDTLFGALGVVAASQGTMNNFIWGNDKLQYYETICGGTGADKEHHGIDAVEYRRVDDLTFAAGARVENGAQHAERQQHSAAAEIRHQIQRRHRFVARFADQMQGTRQREVVNVVPGGICQRAGLAPSGHASIGELWISSEAGVRAESQAFSHSRAKSLDKTVGLFDKPKNGFNGKWVFEVASQGFAVSRQRFDRRGRL